MDVRQHGYESAQGGCTKESKRRHMPCAHLQVREQLPLRGSDTSHLVLRDRNVAQQRDGRPPQPHAPGPEAPPLGHCARSTHFCTLALAYGPCVCHVRIRVMRDMRMRGTPAKAAFLAFAHLLLWRRPGLHGCIHRSAPVGRGIGQAVMEC